MPTKKKTFQQLEDTPSNQLDESGNQSDILNQSEQTIQDTTKDTNLHQQEHVQEYCPPENHILEIRTMAGPTFKNLLDTLKAVLSEANIIISDKGWKISAVDSHKHAYVHLFMEASSFQFFHCKQRMVIGIDMDQLHKSVKGNSTNDLISFIVRNEEPKIFEVSYENSQTGEKTIDRLPIRTLQEYNIRDTIEFKVAAEISSHVFQKLCRDMIAQSADFIEIMVKRNKLTFINKNGPTTKIKEIPLPNHPMQDGESQPVQEEASGIFSLKFLKYFTKAASLSPKVKLYLKDYCPLLCEYSVSGLGTLRYMLSCEELDENGNVIIKRKSKH